jgi:hypothetical protein
MASEYNLRTRESFKERLLDKKNIILLGLLLSASLYFIYPELFFVSLLTLVASFIKYMRIKRNFPIGFEPVFFFAVMITWSYGVSYNLIFLFFSVIVIDLLTAQISIGTILAIIVLTVLPSTVLFFPGYSIVFVGLVLSFAEAIVSFFLGIFMNLPPDKKIVGPASNIIINLAYFFTVAELLEVIL